MRSQLRVTEEHGKTECSDPIGTHVVRVLVRLRAACWSGDIRLTTGGSRTTLNLRQGQIVFATSGEAAPSLCRFLVSRGILTKLQSAALLQASDQTSDRSFSGLATLAINRFGILAPVLHDATQAYVHAKLVECLAADEIAWTLSSSDTPIELRYPVSLESALYEALERTSGDYRWVQRLMLYADQNVVLASGVDEIARRMRASGSEMRAIGALHGRRVEEALQLSEVGPQKTGALLLLLVLTDFATLNVDPITVDNRRSKAPLTSSDKVAPRARSGIRAAQKVRAEAAARRISRMPRASSPEERRRHTADCLRRDVAMARRVTTPPPGSVVIGEDASDPRAAFEDGRRSLELRAYAVAARKFREASTLMPESDEFRLWWRWASLLAASDEASKARVLQLLRATIVSVLQRDRRCAVAHYLHGRLCHLEGQEEHALRAMEIAVKLDGGMLDAHRYVRLLRLRVG